MILFYQFPKERTDQKGEEEAAFLSADKIAFHTHTLIQERVAGNHENQLISIIRVQTAKNLQTPE